MTMRLLILKILCGDESLISILHFLCKAIVSIYYSVNLPLLLSKKVLSCSILFINFLILYTLRLIILFRFLFYVTALYLLFLFLASNMSRIGSVFDVNVSCIVDVDFNNFRSFLIFSNYSVQVDVHVNADNYLNHNFYDHKFQSKPESNSNNFKLEIPFSVYIILKHNHELRIKIFEFLILISVLIVMKYFNYSEVYEGIKTCQSYFFTYESINIYVIV